MSIQRSLVLILITSFSILLITACNPTSPATPGTMGASPVTSAVAGTPVPSATPEPPTPTPTPVPLAAVVNGEPIMLAEYQSEVTQFQVAETVTGTNLASGPNMLVLDNLINQTLLAQAADENGFTLDEAALQARIDALSAQLGGSQALQDWETAQGYSVDDFRLTLRRSVRAAWMRDKITAGVPETADQVHVRQILLPTPGEANDVYASLQSGADFIDLAYTYDPSTGGDLGWFPHGYLDDPAIEEAAFALQPGTYSQVIKTDVGYHILYLVEEDASHPLLPEVRAALQVKALQDWVTARRGQSQIQILVP